MLLLFSYSTLLQCYSVVYYFLCRSLVASSYSQDLSVQDGTGVPHLGSNEGWSWNKDRYTPTTLLCKVWNAWEELILAVPFVSKTNEPFRYDLINTGK